MKTRPGLGVGLEVPIPLPLNFKWRLYLKVKNLGTLLFFISFVAEWSESKNRKCVVKMQLCFTIFRWKIIPSIKISLNIINIIPITDLKIIFQKRKLIHITIFYTVTAIIRTLTVSVFRD